MSNSSDSKNETWLEHELRELDWDIPPSRDLWPDIHSRILFADRRAEHAMTKRRVLAPFAIAASTLIAAVSLTFSYMSYQLVQETNRNQQSMALYQQAQLNLIEEQHKLVRVQFVNLLENDSDQLNSDFVVEAKQLMQQIDQASAEIKRAIEQQPNNPDFAAMLANTYQQEVKLLNQVRVKTAVSI